MFNMVFSEKRIYAYIGTYTQNGGKGIYIYNLDPDTGNMELVGISSELENPSYLSISHDNRYLYAVSEADSVDGAVGGAAAAYMIEKHTGKLMFLNSVTAKGSLSCHISTDKANTCLFAANYGEGSLIAFRLNADGSIGSTASYIRHHGSGPNPERQEKPHVHFTTLTPDEKYLCAVDLGIDKIVVYGLDANNQAKLLTEEFSVPVRPGSGPRHMAFSPDGRFAWVINELSSDIFSFAYDSSVPSFTGIECKTALPEDFTGVSYGAAIQVSPDGNFLYASNRGHDSIVAYKIDKSTGRLGQPFFTPSQGSWPRDFSIDPTGKFLFAANEHSGNIVPFSIQPDSGMLEPLGKEIAVPDPVCIKFAVLD